MSTRNVLRRIAVPALFLALVPFVSTNAAVRDLSESREANRSVDRLDQQLRRVVDPVVATRISERVHAETHRGATWSETMFDALAVAASELNLLEEQGLLDAESRNRIGAFTVVTVLRTLVENHPELEPKVESGLSTRRTSPIEDLCECDRRGSSACGCQVVSTGYGDCEYHVRCPSMGRAFCSTINLQMCAARTVIDIVAPIR